jgi:hypothetical protein
LIESSVNVYSSRTATALIRFIGCKDAHRFIDTFVICETSSTKARIEGRYHLQRRGSSTKARIICTKGGVIGCKDAHRFIDTFVICEKSSTKARIITTKAHVIGCKDAHRFIDTFVSLRRRVSPFAKTRTVLQRFYDIRSSPSFLYLDSHRHRHHLWIH